MYLHVEGYPKHEDLDIGSVEWRKSCHCMTLQTQREKYKKVWAKNYCYVVECPGAFECCKTACTIRMRREGGRVGGWKGGREKGRERRALLCSAHPVFADIRQELELLC